MPKKRFRMSVKQRIEKGDYRIAKLNVKLMPKYAGVPNVLIFPSYGWGPGVDFLVAQGNKIFELREVTNFDMHACTLMDGVCLYTPNLDTIYGQ